MPPAQVQLRGARCTHPELGHVREELLGACHEQEALRHLLLQLEGTELHAQHLLTLGRYVGAKPSQGWCPPASWARGDTTSSSPQQDAAGLAVAQGGAGGAGQPQ